ncbi:MAG TPA: response regulator transcription factor [Prolixibacteraceae bacterium]|nr:response regulator transcription factor [Prolixibacteraceae bacterium]
MINVAIVDDHPLLVEGLKNLIADSKVAILTDSAQTGSDCLKMLSFKQPDVLLLDINLPDCNGIDLCKEISTKWPSLNIMALTSFGEFTSIRKMLENGAKGYLLKNAMPEEIILGIETVARGEKFLCHEVDLFMKKQTNRHIFLTPRETDLLRLIVKGYTNPEIANELFLGIETINSYRKNLLFKLNARNTAVLVKIALEEKLI